MFGKLKAGGCLMSSSLESSGDSSQFSIYVNMIPPGLKNFVDSALQKYPSDPLPFALFAVEKELESKQRELESKQRELESKQREVELQKALISAKEDELVRLNKQVAVEEIKVRGLEGSRVILESACQSYSKKNSKLSSLTTRYNDFKDKVLLPGGNLSSDSNMFLAALAKCGLIAQPRSVKDEASYLLASLSKQHHSLPMELDKGLYIGGEIVTTVTLAVCLLHMQKLGHWDLDVRVIDELGKPKCILTNGQVICTP
jgi:hypothetical protein